MARSPASPFIDFLPSVERLNPTGGDQQEEPCNKKRVNPELDNRKDESELLANIRCLTVRVLDDLEEGSRNRTLDQQQKRLLSSTGARLLRLWRLVEEEGKSKRATEAAGRVDGPASEPQNAEPGDERV
jgi:hypothetical protein